LKDKDNLLSLADKTSDSRFISPKQTLEDCIAMLGREGKGAWTDCNKLLVIAIDTNEEGYDISWSQSNMKVSECITVCEVAKSSFLAKMGY